MVQLHPRSLVNDWSVSVSVARVRGKDEGRVQFPDGPLTNKWGVGPTGRRLVCTQEIGVRLPDAPLKGSWSKGISPARQAGHVLLGIRRVQFPVGPLFWKVAGYGWPGRFAKPCGAARCRVGSNPMPSAVVDECA